MKHETLADIVADRDRLRQYIQHHADATTDPDVWANFDAALQGEFLYQHLPGWDSAKPLEKPANSAGGEQ